MFLNEKLFFFFYFLKALEGDILKILILSFRQKQFIFSGLFFNQEQEWKLYTQMNNAVLIKPSLLQDNIKVKA